MKAQTYLKVDQKKIGEASLEHREIPSIGDGQALFKVTKFALTANNITYAVIADQLKYFDFFPTEKPFGIIPVWGFGEIIQSNDKKVKVGDKFYGYFPMGTHLVVDPAKVTPFGFADGADHRKALAPIYNYYYNVASDRVSQNCEQDYLPIVRPLFTTSFLIYHHLAEKAFLNAEQIIISSASSKTALGTAAMFSKESNRPKVVGVTSERNLAFVKETGLYDEVYTYKQVEKITQKGSVMIDFAGNAALMNELFGHLEAKLLSILQIGMTDWGASKDFQSLKMASWFFAPTAAENRYKEWGVEKTTAMIAEALESFVGMISKYIDIQRITSLDDIEKHYLTFLSGKIDPSKGLIFEP